MSGLWTSRFQWTCWLKIDLFFSTLSVSDGKCNLLHLALNPLPVEFISAQATLLSLSNNDVYFPLKNHCLCKRSHITAWVSYELSIHFIVEPDRVERWTTQRRRSPQTWTWFRRRTPRWRWRPRAARPRSSAASQGSRLQNEIHAFKSN